MTVTSHERLKPPATWLFIQQFFHANDSIKFPLYWPFVRESTGEIVKLSLSWRQQGVGNAPWGPSQYKYVILPVYKLM